MSLEPREEKSKTKNDNADNAAGNQKREDDEASEKISVHSANSWEDADLGDQGRNNKFLRLMGAAKKQHSGRFVIGDQDSVHKRSGADTRHLNEDLESQYEHSMEHRLAGGRRGHIGLGFTEESETTPGEQTQGWVADKSNNQDDKEAKVDSTSKVSDGGDIKKSDEASNSRPDDRKRESTDNSASPVEKKMKFVKSSS